MKRLSIALVGVLIVGGAVVAIVTNAKAQLDRRAEIADLLESQADDLATATPGGGKDEVIDALREDIRNIREGLVSGVGPRTSAEGIAARRRFVAPDAEWGYGPAECEAMPPHVTDGKFIASSTCVTLAIPGRGASVMFLHPDGRSVMVDFSSKGELMGLANGRWRAAAPGRRPGRRFAPDRLEVVFDRNDPSRVEILTEDGESREVTRRGVVQ